MTTDFDACFPPGTMIGPGNVLTIAVSATGFFSTYGTNPDFEIRDDDAVVPIMVDAGGNAGSFATALLANSSEFVVLCCCDGARKNEGPGAAAPGPSRVRPAGAPGAADDRRPTRR